jgi:hypothetical protein
MLDEHIGRLTRDLGRPAASGAAFDTCRLLVSLAASGEGAPAGPEALDFIARKAELSGRLYRGYDEGGRRCSDEIVSPQWHLLAALVILRECLRRLDGGGNPVELLKRSNAVLKLRDQSSARAAGAADPALGVIDERIAGVVSRAASDIRLAHREDAPPVPSLGEGASTPKVLPITVLFWEGPIARAYLATIRSLGCRPREIIQLVSAVDLATRKRVGRFLPSFLRLGYAEYRQRNSIHYWSRLIATRHRDLYTAIGKVVSERLGFAPGVLEEARALRPLEEYSDCITRIPVDNLGDDRLYSHLSGRRDLGILFTGGGIVPRRLLEIPTVRFIHVHPGYLPDIRGADCVLWSQLTAGSTSATCFLMAPGIDDGDVITPCYLPRAAFGINGDRFPAKTLYRAIYAFFDPWVRGYALRRSIDETGGFARVDPRPQEHGRSVTFHFMHEMIQKVVFRDLFPS